MAANKNIGGINVTITATIEKFQKNITAARRMISTFTKSITGLVFNLKTLGAALALGGLAKLVANQFTAISALKDLADKTGVSTDKLAGLQLAAEEAGISSAVLEKGLVKLNTEMGMRGDLALRSWIEKTSKLATQQEKLAAATKMFGARGADMVRFLNGGTAAIDEAQKAAEAMGAAISMDVAIGVDRAAESFVRLKKHITGVFASLAGEIAPYVELLSVKTMEMIGNSGGGSGVGRFIADVIVEMSKNVVDLIQKMVATGMEAFLGLQMLVVQFRTSAVGSGMGLGYGTPKESFQAIAGLGASSQRLEAFKSNNWAGNMQAWIDEARKQSADAAVKATTADSVGRVMGWLETGKSAFESIKENGPAAFGKFSQMKNGALGNLVEGFFNLGGPGHKNAKGRTPALSFAESGSVESYRQQAAIRKQGDDIAKKQLGVQQQIRDGINNLADVINFPAANLKG